MGCSLTNEAIEQSIARDDEAAKRMADGSRELLQAILKARQPRVKVVYVNDARRGEPVARPGQVRIPMCRPRRTLWPRWYRPPSLIASMPHATLDAVALHFGVTKDMILGLGRSSVLVDARVTCAAILRRRGLSYNAIGRLMKRDHSTLIHLIGKLDIYERRNPLVTEAIIKLAA